MANPLRGEVPIPGSIHSLRYDVNALCEVEAATGKTFMDIVDELQERPSLRLVRTLFWCALKGSRQGSNLSEIAAGDIISDIGFEETARLIGEAIREANIFEEQGQKSEMGKK